MSARQKQLLCMTIGKACALCVLMLSLSNQMTIVVGASYFNTASFAVCFLSVLLVAAFLKPLKNPTARLALAVITAAAGITWITTIIYIQVFITSSTLIPDIVLLIYSFLGKVVTCIINMQWSYRFALLGVDETPKHVASSTVLSLAILFICLAADTFLRQFLLVAILLASILLNLVVAYSELADPEAPYSSSYTLAQDASHPVSEESHLATRIAYFGSRSVYGICLGLLVYLSTFASPAQTQHRQLVISVALLALAYFAALATNSFSKRGNHLSVISIPVIGALLIYLAFYSTKYEGLPHLYALLAELTWTAQNLFQLPSYRRICKLHPAQFAYGDTLAHIIPYYLLVWALSSSSSLDTFFSTQPVLTEMLATICILLLVIFCMFAMGRHTMKYLPESRGQAETPRPAEEREAALATQAQQLDLLTPRERDVFVLLASGYSRAYIGKVLHIAPDTVKVHARHIYAKLGIGSRDELIKFGTLATPPHDSAPHA